MKQNEAFKTNFNFIIKSNICLNYFFNYSKLKITILKNIKLRIKLKDKNYKKQIF